MPQTARNGLTLTNWEQVSLRYQAKVSYGSYLSIVSISILTQCRSCVISPEASYRIMPQISNRHTAPTQ